jgi:hypothetical protein
MTHSYFAPISEYERMKNGLTTARLFNIQRFLYYPEDCIQISFVDESKHIRHILLFEVVTCSVIRIDLLMIQIFLKAPRGRNTLLLHAALENFLFDLGYDSVKSLISSETKKHFKSKPRNFQFLQMYHVQFRLIKIIS